MNMFVRRQEINIFPLDKLEALARKLAENTSSLATQPPTEGTRRLNFPDTTPETHSATQSMCTLSATLLEGKVPVECKFTHDTSVNQHTRLGDPLPGKWGIQVPENTDIPDKKR